MGMDSGGALHSLRAKEYAFNFIEQRLEDGMNYLDPKRTIVGSQFWLAAGSDYTSACWLELAALGPGCIKR
jgi:hypothetical protein